MKKLLFIFLFVFPAFAMDQGLVKIDKQSFFATHDLTDLDLYHGASGFSVLKDGQFQRVQVYNTDKNIRNITPEQLARFQMVGYLALKRASDGEYKVNANVRGLGGGIFGAQAGFWTGKFAVHLAARLGYGVVAGVAGFATMNPAVALATYGALEATFAAPVEAASNIVGLGCSITGAVTTGPL